MAKLLDLYKATKAEAEADIDSVGLWTARPGREMAKRQAQAELPNIVREYESALAERWGAMLVSSDDVERVAKFVEIAGPSAAVVDIRDFYKQLASVIEPVMRRDRQFEPSQFAHLLSQFERVVKQLGVNGAPVLRYTGAPILSDEAALAEHIRGLVNQQDGSRVVLAWIRRAIADAAFAMGYQRAALPVVVLGATENEHAGLKTLFDGRVVAVVLDAPVDDAVVAEAFQALKKNHYEK